MISEAVQKARKALSFSLSRLLMYLFRCKNVSFLGGLNGVTFKRELTLPVEFVCHHITSEGILHLEYGPVFG